LGSQHKTRSVKEALSSVCISPYPLLSDDRLLLTHALSLPTFASTGMTLLKRLTMIIHDGVIEHVFYPVFPPDRNAAEVLAQLETQCGK
jgi:peroxiredoxin